MPPESHGPGVSPDPPALAAFGWRAASLNARREQQDNFVAVAQMEARNHEPDEKRGGCTCGFCAWSVEHVVIMSIWKAQGR